MAELSESSQRKPLKIDYRESIVDTSQVINIGRAARKTSSRISRILEQPKTRRDTLKIIGGSLAAAMGVDGAVSLAKHVIDSVSHPDSVSSLPPVEPLAQPKAPEVSPHTPTPDIPVYLTRLEKILETPPFMEDGSTKNTVRQNMEKAYVNELRSKPQESITLDEIDKGLSVLAFEDQRRQLMQLRFNLRQNHYFESQGVMPCDQAHIAWAQENGISTEMLAICLDNEERAKKIIKSLFAQGELRDEINEQIKAGVLPPDTLETMDVTNFMINPGGMAELFMQETRGFTFIGEFQAKSQLSGKYSSQRETSLPALCRLLQQNTGLSYEPDNIPGSGKGGPENESGGAIGAQFMPGNALEYMTLIHDATGEWLNPFDPSDATVMAWVFLARQKRVGDGPKDFRVGYMRGDPEAIKYALYKWNQLPAEEQAIYNDAIDYFNRFEQNTSGLRKKRTELVANSSRDYLIQFHSLAA